MFGYREPDARDDSDIEGLIETTPTEASWCHQWNQELPDFGDFPGAGKRLGNKRLRRWQCVKVGPLADALEDIGEAEAALAMRNCGCFLIRERYARGSLFRAMNECNHLVCPTGQMRRAARLVESKGAALERFIEKRRGARPLMMTLTTEAVASYDLWVAVNQILAAFAKLMRRAAIRRAFLAWLRSLEVTRNPQTGRWMVHLHCVVVVDGPAYFKRGSKIYLEQPALRQFWKQSLRASYNPQVDIRPLQGSFAPLDVKGRKSLQECLKYCFKPSSLIFSTRGGKPALIGTKTRELFDPADGQGLRWMTNVPLRALIQALKDRRLVQTSANLQGNEDLDFKDDPDAKAKSAAAELGDFICTEVFAWRVFRGQGDFFLVGRSFERPERRGGFSMGP